MNMLPTLCFVNMQLELLSKMAYTKNTLQSSNKGNHPEVEDFYAKDEKNAQRLRGTVHSVAYEID